jgi:hypothetical protein
VLCRLEEFDIMAESGKKRGRPKGWSREAKSRKKLLKKVRL